MSSPDSSHPDHECDDCGKTHMSYTGHVEFAKRNEKTRNILILIACLSLMSVPLGLTVFDYAKEPSMLDSNIDYSLFDVGYDIVCFSDYEMQYCVVDNTESNRIAYNSERLVLQVEQYPCLNVYISTPEKIRDVFLITDGSDCIGSLEFPILNGWSWKEGMIHVGLSGEELSGMFFIGKSDPTFWWEDLNNELESMSFAKKL